jgi:hypothetical protein
MKRFISYLTGLCLAVFCTSVIAAPATLAVLTFKPIKSAAQHANHDIDTNAILSAHVAHNLAETNKFSLIDPNYISSIKKKINHSNLSSIQAAQQLGALLDARFLVSGVVETFNINQTQATQPYTDITEHIRSGRITVNVSVVDAQSGEIISSMLVNTDKRIVLNPKKPMSEESFTFALESDAAKNIAAKITDSIYPARIMQVNGETVFIDRGASSDFIPGELLTAYQQGDALIDPDTGKPFGFNTHDVGTLKVTTLKHDYTLATILSGDPKELIKAIVKKTAGKPKPTHARYSDTAGSGDKPFKW